MGWKHLPALDGLRGIAVMMVMVHHLFLTKVYPVPERVEMLVHSGWMGVDLFFVLSGFLITGILLDAKHGPHRFINFYMRRVLRIFPLYYGVLAFFLIFLPLLSVMLGGGPSFLRSMVAELDPIRVHQWRLWLYLQNFGGSWKLFNHFWSLAVEEHFYLFWPAVIFFTSERGALRACCVAVVVAICCRLLWLKYDIPTGHLTRSRPVGSTHWRLAG